VDEVFLAYLRAKLAAEEYIGALDLDATTVRPGRLTDERGTGRVTLGPRVERGDIARDDVASVVLALLDTPETAGAALEVVGGDTPVDAAVEAVAQRGASSSA
jgi:uncharacterized protein YbjT (DUF2867 family)